MRIGIRRNKKTKEFGLFLVIGSEDTFIDLQKNWKQVKEGRRIIKVLRKNEGKLEKELRKFRGSSLKAKISELVEEC